jgi:hypothetical protein
MSDPLCSNRNYMVYIPESDEEVDTRDESEEDPFS